MSKPRTYVFSRADLDRAKNFFRDLEASHAVTFSSPEAREDAEKWLAHKFEQVAHDGSIRRGL